MKTYTYRVIIEPDGKEFHGFVPVLTGCHTCGRTIQETKNRLNDAIALYLENLKARGKTLPKETSLESFETVTLSQKVYA